MWSWSNGNTKVITTKPPQASGLSGSGRPPPHRPANCSPLGATSSPPHGIGAQGARGRGAKWTPAYLKHSLVSSLTPSAVIAATPSDGLGTFAANGMATRASGVRAAA
jgi:hypothetical protein